MKRRSGTRRQSRLTTRRKAGAIVSISLTLGALAAASAMPERPFAVGTTDTLTAACNNTFQPQKFPLSYNASATAACPEGVLFRRPVECTHGPITIRLPRRARSVVLFVRTAR